MDCILGYPWLTEQEATVDLKRRCIHFGTDRRFTAYWHVQAPATTNPIPTADELKHGFPAELVNEFNDLLRRFPAVTDVSKRTTTRTVTHRIALKHNRPIRSPPYRVSDEKKRIIQDQVEEMLRDGIIRPSTSPYASPVVLVPKKDGTLRFCADYRRINDATESEPTPMPIVQDTVRDLGDARVFSVLDLKSGYWQIPMEEESKPVTAFTTPDGGQYEFEVMPFGLKNAPASFQRLTSQKVLAGFLRRFANVFLDDIVVYSETHEEHMVHLAQVFERLQEHGLCLNLEKCEFGKDSITYLGHHVTEDSTEPIGKHLEQISEAKPPQTRKELRQFLGLCNWVRDYVPNFADISAPLTDLLSVKKQYRWTQPASAAFERVQAAFRQPLRLRRPSPHLPYVLQTDASGIGIGAVLYQRDGDQRHVISYASARLTKTEQRYHINEQECLALIWAVKRYRPLLEGKHFTVVTDSKALTWLQRFQESKAKLLRWSLLLQEFDFDIEHCAGTENQLADALSRQPDAENVPPDDESRLLPPEPGHINAVLDEPLLPELIQESQRLDRQTQNILRLLEEPRNAENEAYHDAMENHEGILRFSAPPGEPTPLYVPAEMRTRVLHAHHDESGHPGREETYRAITQRYFWPDTRKHVQLYVQRCLTCAAIKPGAARPAAPLKPRSPTSPWHTVSVDLMGPYPKTATGKTHILVATDPFTKWVEAYPTGEPRAHILIRLLEENIFNRFGYPKVVLSDNGPQFKCARWMRACRRWGADAYHTGIYHARANPVERRNQEIKKGLRARMQGQPHTKWAQFLPAILRDLRTRRNAATGYSPSKALLGYELPLPGDRDLEGREPIVEAPMHEHRDERLDDIRQHLLTYQRRYAGGEAQERYDVGDQVMVRAHPQSDAKRQFHAGFHPRWLGPYNIRELHSGRVYTVDRDGTPVRVPAFDVKPAPRPPSPEDAPRSPLSTIEEPDSDQDAPSP